MPYSPGQTVRRLGDDSERPVVLLQWYLLNGGQAGGIPGRDINVVPAWDVVNGAGIRIIVNDTGADFTNPDLSPNFDFATSQSLDPPYNNPYPFSGDAHGTETAGLIAAASNGYGITGGRLPRTRLLLPHPRHAHRQHRSVGRDRGRPAQHRQLRRGQQQLGLPRGLRRFGVRSERRAGARGDADRSDGRARRARHHQRVRLRQRVPVARRHQPACLPEQHQCRGGRGPRRQRHGERAERPLLHARRERAGQRAGHRHPVRHHRRPRQLRRPQPEFRARRDVVRSPPRHRRGRTDAAGQPASRHPRRAADPRLHRPQDRSRQPRLACQCGGELERRRAAGLQRLRLRPGRRPRGGRAGAKLDHAAHDRQPHHQHRSGARHRSHRRHRHHLHL